MHSNLTIGKRFLITSGVLLFLSFTLAAVAIAGLNSIRTNVHSLSVDSIPGLNDSASLAGVLQSLRGDYLTHIAEENAAGIQQALDAIATDTGRLAPLMKDYAATISHEDDRQNFNALQSEVTAVQAGWLKVLPVSTAGKNVEAYRLYQVEVSPHMTLAIAQLDKMVKWNKNFADETIAASNHSIELTWWFTLGMSLAVMVFGIGTSWFMVNVLHRQLNTTVDELSTGSAEIAAAASQVASTSQLMAQGASEQAASLEETSAAAEEINAMAVRNTQNTGEMTLMVADSQTAFDLTNVQLREMVSAMEEIDSSSSKIARIIKVIDEIAFQTNILALNAAVEAARAGEAGMGFAVVADEVRSLAQRCAGAAHDISDLIEESMVRSGAGMVKVGQVASAIQNITDQFFGIKRLVEQVGVSSKEQSEGIGQIRRSLSQMEQVTQNSAASAEEGAASAEQLNAQSLALQDIVGQLNQMAGIEAQPQSFRHGTRGLSERLQATSA
jgi:methyl-accepting chemotaxis protein/methyl-accepting chemotaxis protein-1 (serine sensor receptor)